MLDFFIFAFYLLVLRRFWVGVGARVVLALDYTSCEKHRISLNNADLMTTSCSCESDFVKKAKNSKVFKNVLSELPIKMYANENARAQIIHHAYDLKIDDVELPAYYCGPLSLKDIKHANPTLYSILSFIFRAEL